MQVRIPIPKSQAVRIFISKCLLRSWKIYMRFWFFSTLNESKRRKIREKYNTYSAKKFQTDCDLGIHPNAPLGCSRKENEIWYWKFLENQDRLVRNCNSIYIYIIHGRGGNSDFETYRFEGKRPSTGPLCSCVFLSAFRALSSPQCLSRKILQCSAEKVFGFFEFLWFVKVGGTLRNSRAIMRFRRLFDSNPCESIGLISNFLV